MNILGRQRDAIPVLTLRGCILQDSWMQVTVTQTILSGWKEPVSSWNWEVQVLICLLLIFKISNLSISGKIRSKGSNSVVWKLLWVYFLSASFILRKALSPLTGGKKTMSCSGLRVHRLKIQGQRARLLFSIGHTSITGPITVPKKIHVLTGQA